MGKQSMYNVIITVDVGEYGESDSWSHLFGFRKIESYIDSRTGGRYCYVTFSNRLVLSVQVSTLSFCN